jgi:hypothetical protein
MGNTNPDYREPHGQRDDHPTMTITRPPSAPAAAQQVAPPTPLQAAHSLIEGTNDAFKKHLADVEADAAHEDPNSPSLTPDGIKRRIDEFASSDDAAAIERALEMANARERAAEAKRNAALAAINSAPGDAAVEMRRQRVLDRTLRSWDAQAGDTGRLVSTMQQAITNADDDELGVIIPEIEPYLNTHGVKDTAFVQPLLAQRVPALGEAERELALARQGRQIIGYEANTVRTGIQKRSPATSLPGIASHYDPDRVIG